MRYVEDLEKRGRRFGETCSAKYVGDLDKRVRRFGETCSAIWSNLFGKIRWRFGETCSVIWRTCSVKYVGDLEKRGRRFGELVRQNTLAVLYWSSLWSSVELGDHNWRLNRNGEKVEIIYGD